MGLVYDGPGKPLLAACHVCPDVFQPGEYFAAHDHDSCCHHTAEYFLLIFSIVVFPGEVVPGEVRLDVGIFPCLRSYHSVGYSG